MHYLHFSEFFISQDFNICITWAAWIGLPVGPRPDPGSTAQVKYLVTNLSAVGLRTYKSLCCCIINQLYCNKCQFLARLFTFMSVSMSRKIKQMQHKSYLIGSWYSLHSSDLLLLIYKYIYHPFLD